MAAISTIAAVGVGVAAVGAVGQAYAANKAANQQQKMANIQNARERRMALRSMRMSQRALEGMGVQSGTVGSSAQLGAIGAAASATASGIGYQGAQLANALQITNWNNMATGFGALSQVGSSIYSNKEVLGEMFNNKKSNPTLKPTAATINTGAEFIGYT